MNLKWAAPEMMEYYLRSRVEKNARINKALEICRKNVFFTLRECPKRNLLRIVAHRVMVVNFLLRHFDETGALPSYEADLVEDSEMLYSLLRACCGASIKKQQVLNTAGAWALYCARRGEWLKELDYHMEEVYSRSWSDRSHAWSALKLIPDFFQITAFLLRQAEYIPLTPGQYDLLLEDEETCYSYLLGALPLL